MEKRNTGKEKKKNNKGFPYKKGGSKRGERRERKNIIILMIFLISFLVIISILFGVYSSNNFPESMRQRSIIGCWRRLDSDRLILIKTQDLSIREIGNTLRHEVCHEIYWRLNNKTFYREETEEFAKDCIISDYYENNNKDKTGDN